MRIGTYQFAPIFGDLNANRSRVELELTRRLDRYTDSTGSAPDFLVLPELAFSGYHFTSPAEAKSLGEPVDGESASVLLRLAQRFGTHIAAGYAELAEDGSLYNSSMLVGPNGIEGNYRKVHLFHEETIHFRPGDNTAPGGSRETAADPESIFPLYRIGKVKVGMLVCFDHMFPETARSLALQGAQIILHPSNLVLRGYAQLTTRVHSIHNRVFWAMTNRWGTETQGGKKLTFTGASQIIAYNGEVLAHSPEWGDDLQIVEIDPENAKNKKVTEISDLFADRRQHRDSYLL